MIFMIPFLEMFAGYLTNWTIMRFLHLHMYDIFKGPEAMFADAFKS